MAEIVSPTNMGHHFRSHIFQESWDKYGHPNQTTTFIPQNHFKKEIRKNWFFFFCLGELVAERADMIVAPLTINPERAQACAQLV